MRTPNVTHGLLLFLYLSAHNNLIHIRPVLVENLFQLPESSHDGRGRAALLYHYLIIITYLHYNKGKRFPSSVLDISLNVA